MTGLLYPEMFNEYRDKIQHNIADKRHPLEDLGTKILVFKRQLQVKALAWEEPLTKEAYRLLIKDTVVKEVAVDGSLKDWIQKKSSVEIGEIAYLASTHMDEINKWTEGEKAVFSQMAFHDSQKVLWKMMGDLKKEKTELDQEDKSKERRLKKLEKQLTEKDEVETVAKRHHSETNKKQQAEIESLLQQLSSKEQVAATQIKDQPMLVTETDFVLVTRFNPQDYASMLPINQIVFIQHVEDLLNVQLNSDVKYIFIHSDGFSSKEHFYLEEIIESYEKPFKLVSGCVAAVMRQLIFYIEGAMMNEITT